MMFQSIDLPIRLQQYPYLNKHVAWFLIETTYARKALTGLIHYVQSHRCENQPILIWNTYGRA
jgi:hypothetical protein